MKKGQEINAKFKGVDGTVTSNPYLERRNLPTYDFVYQISYSSGTTGVPKGSMITQRNIISSLSGGRSQGYTFNEEDTYLSYVPLSHIQEQIIVTNCLIFGIKIGYPRFAEA